VNPFFKLALDFDKTLAPGVHVQVRWTNCNRYHRAVGEVVKVNTNSARIKLLSGKSVPDLYPVGYVITQNRMTPSKMPLWSWNNCILPDTEEFRNA
jgi:hypothetical protein